MNFLERLARVQVGENELALSWLAQAGFALKTHGGKVILIDPYLSDYVNRIFQKELGQGFRRMTTPLFEPEDITADVLLCSHEHQDHLDIDSLPGLLKNPRLLCHTNGVSIEEVKKNGLDPQRFRKLEKKQTLSFGDFELTVTDCDHGEATPEALGFILDFGFVTIYYSGDTGYNKERLADALERKTDVALLPINGAYGNLNAREAAQFAADLKAKLCIPHHFWTFPNHDAPLGSPRDALEFFPKFAPDCVLRLMTPGEFILIGPSGAILREIPL
jgi:L-ascorbate 6-phosphate lactonase